MLGAELSNCEIHTNDKNFSFETACVKWIMNHGFSTVWKTAASACWQRCGWAESESAEAHDDKTRD